MSDSFKIKELLGFKEINVKGLSPKDIIHKILQLAEIKDECVFYPPSPYSDYVSVLISAHVGSVHVKLEGTESLYAVRIYVKRDDKKSLLPFVISNGVFDSTAIKNFKKLYLFSSVVNGIPK